MQVKFIILFQVIFQNKQKNYSNAARSRYFILREIRWFIIDSKQL